MRSSRIVTVGALTVVAAIGLGLGSGFRHARRAVAQDAAPPAVAPAVPAVPAAPAASGARPAASTARPLTAAQIEQAETYRDKLLNWTRELDRVFPALSRYAQPSHADVLGTLEEDLLALEPADVLTLEGEFADHPAFWELPQFIESIYKPEVPVPPYYREAMLEWSAHGYVDHEMAKRLALDVDRAARSRMISPLEPGASLAPGGAGRIGPPGGSNRPDAVPTPDATATVPFPAMPEFPPRGSLPDATERVGCPGIYTGNACSGCTTFVPTEAIYAIKFGVIAASAAADIFDPDIDFCFPLVCTCITVPYPPYFIAQAIKIALEAVQRGLEFNNALANFCEDGVMFAIIDTFLDTTVSSRVTQASLDAHSELELKLDIEDNLLNQRDDRISLYQMPSSVCGEALPDGDPGNMTGYEGFRFCGKLELVRQIVKDAIDENAASGMLLDVNGARAELDAGDVQYLLKHYKSAYERYSTAYRYAVSQESRP